jgi:hypothetical protein
MPANRDGLYRRSDAYGIWRAEGVTDALAFKVVMGSLRPADPAAEAAVKALGNGALCGVRLTKSSRNLKRMRLYRAMLAAACDVLANQVPGLQPSDLHTRLKQELGLGEWLTFPSGAKLFKPQSTAFGKMTEPEFSAYVTRVDGLLSRWLGVPPGEVIDAARAMVGEA